jgi:hypothetical protein
MNMTMAELKINKYACDYFSAMTREIVQMERLDEKRLDNMNYMELITMLEMSRDEKYESEYSDGTPCPTKVFNLFLYRVLLLMLKTTEDQVTAVRLFLEMPVSTYCKYMDNLEKENRNGIVRHQSLQYNHIMHEIEKLHGEFDEKTTTLREVLAEIYKKTNRPWALVDKSIEDYQKTIMAELWLFKKLFGYKFRVAFPEQTEEFKVRGLYAFRAGK